MHFVALTVSDAEQEKRIVAESRAEFRKLRSVEVLRQIRKMGASLHPPMPDSELTIDTTSLPPPDNVPMMDAPPPMSEPSPTTTPAEMRPSTIDVPSVPAL